MRNNIYLYICAALLMAAGVELKAQNLDPTVVVDRAYEGKLVEFHKPSLEMAVPDSVMRFDLDFDYSVFDSPYKGSYEFNPYLLSMKPDVSADDAGKFYLRAGAGYQLHPELDMVWSPIAGKTSESVNLDVYARHRSFIGNYEQIGLVDNQLTSGKSVWKGFDLDSKAGAALVYDWASGKLGVDVGYYGLHQKDVEWKRGYNAVDASFGISSKNLDYKQFFYDIFADYRHAYDHTSVAAGAARIVRENDLGVDVTLGSGLKKGGAFHLGLGMDMASYTGRVEAIAADVKLSPKYLYKKGVLSAELGLKVQTVLGDTTLTGFDFPAKEQYVYPDVKLRVNVLPKYLALFLKADGGTDIVSYSSLLERNHHVNLSVPGVVKNYPESFDRKPDVMGYKMGVNVKRVDASAGFEGRIGARFSYVLSGGYVNYAEGVLDAVYDMVSPVTKLVAGVEYQPYQKTFASVQWLYKGESFSADGKVTYSNSFGQAFEGYSACLKPSALSGDVAFEYNYSRRIFFGADCSFATARSCGNSYVTIPGYADLGVSLEYVTSRNLSLWARGGNLLGMTIQRVPLYAESGVYFTAGICLNL